MGKQNTPMQIPSMDQVAAERVRLLQAQRFRRTLRSTISVLVVVAAVAFLIATLLMPVLQIYGNSMSPSFSEGHYVALLKHAEMKRGDVVAFYYNNKILVKRVIGRPGDWVNIDGEGIVYVNDEMLIEPYLTTKSLGECDIDLPYQVPDGVYFVMGDNRVTSIDSRTSQMGCIRQDQVLGTVFLRFWPLNSVSWIE